MALSIYGMAETIGTITCSDAMLCSTSYVNEAVNIRDLLTIGPCIDAVMSLLAILHTTIPNPLAIVHTTG